MPERNHRFEALVLRSRESPGGDRIATFLGAGEGIVDAFVFGGARSSIRASIAPYTYVNVQIYTNPMKQYRRVSDIAILESYRGIRESYDALLAAGTVAEVILKTSGCGGEYPAVLDLAREMYTLLSADEGASADTLLPAFLWKSLGILGSRPDPGSCVSCGRPLDPAGSAEYSGTLDGFLCAHCARGTEIAERDEQVYGADPGSDLPLDLLARLSDQPLSAWTTIGNADPAGMEMARRFIFSLVQRACEGILLTLRS